MLWVIVPHHHSQLAGSAHGGGFGRVFKLGDQPVNASINAYYNVERPTGAATWSLRTTLALLFPVR
jgi:hypothetical protein